MHIVSKNTIYSYAHILEYIHPYSGKLKEMIPENKVKKNHSLNRNSLGNQLWRFMGSNQPKRSACVFLGGNLQPTRMLLLCFPVKLNTIPITIASKSQFR